MVHSKLLEMLAILTIITPLPGPLPGAGFLPWRPSDHTKEVQAVTAPCGKCSKRAVAQGSTDKSKLTLPVEIRESFIQEIIFDLGPAG